MARAANAGQQTKMELVYEYLTGSLFRQRIEAIVEKFSDMQAARLQRARQLSSVLLGLPKAMKFPQPRWLCCLLVGPKPHRSQ
jgi:hypothetical protein